MITLWLAFRGNAKLFSKVAAPFYISTSETGGLHFSTSPPALVIVHIFIIAILVGGKSYVIVVLTCTFLMTIAVLESFYVLIDHSYIIFGEIYPFKPFVQFLICLSFYYGAIRILYTVV